MFRHPNSQTSSRDEDNVTEALDTGVDPWYLVVWPDSDQDTAEREEQEERACG
jgi:hypothetical protein